VLQRRREYLEGLLDPVGNTQVNNTLVASINDTEPDILIAEVERVIKRAPQFKTAGIDNLPVEII
jgi:hypothetical protein